MNGRARKLVNAMLVAVPRETTAARMNGKTATTKSVYGVVLILFAGCGLVGCDQLPSNPVAPTSTVGAAGAAVPAPAADAQIISAQARSITEDGMDAVIVTDTGVTNIRITNAATGNGQVVVDGRTVCLVECPDRETARPAVAPFIAAALTAYGVYDFIRGCATPAVALMFQQRDLPQSLLVECVTNGAATVAGGPVGKYLKHVGVTRLRNVIKDAVGSRITWNQLRGALNKKNFRSIIDVIESISEELFKPIYSAIYDALRQL